ncbi:MAG: hypothetical protein VX252_11245, partial [Myxococcota bacterium]|nr:hypothetical protein [Myxococcota bacterium]
MDITLEELRPVIDAWRWTEDPSGRLALLALASVLLLASVMLYLPLTIKWMQLAQLDRKLADLAKRASGSIPGRMALWNQAFRKSPAEFQWKELQKVWLFQRNQAGPEALQEPASLAAILDRWPLLPRGLRRRVLESVPGLLMLIGVMGAVLSISVALSTRTSSDGAPALSNLGAAVLSAPLWGLGLALITTIASRLFHGAFEHYSESIDRKTSLAFEPFCDENPRETGTTKAEPLPALEPEIREVPEIESTHIAHLQLNKVTRQMSALIDHLHESGFALRNAASALRSTQGRIENNSEEIRISLKQAASTVVDQGGFIQMSLDQIRTALEKPEVPSPSLHVAERSVTPKDVTLEKQ